MNKQDILDFVMNEIKKIDGVQSDGITTETKLLSTRVLDSINTLNLVNALEEHFGYETTADEVTIENLDTPTLITEYIIRKMVN